VFALVIVSSFANRVLSAQDGKSVVGKYHEEKHSLTIEMFRDGSTYSARQIDTPEEQKKKYNGQLIAKNISIAGTKLSGIVISNTNGKEYPATWMISTDQNSLALKIKWGFLSFSDTWRKIE